MFFIENFNVPQKVVLGTDPTIAKTAIIEKCEFGNYVEIMGYNHLTETKMDDFSYICEYGQVIYTEIGKFANIASMCRINPGFHPMEWATVHHFTYRPGRYNMKTEDDIDFFNWRRLQKVKIGHDTWIGHGVVIMPGVTIGNGAVVGSNSVVTKDVPPYTIVAGSPAKIIRKRFAKEISEVLEQIKWWDWDYETIKERINDFKDIRKFIGKYGN
jgi:phosphonate metabolism protein (transferase hexapeptide repeat family)